MTVTWKKIGFDADIAVADSKAVSAGSEAESVSVSAGTAAASALSAGISAGSQAGSIETSAATAVSAASSSASTADSKAESAAALGTALVSHAASHMNGGSDELTLDDLGEPTAAVNFFHQQAQNLVLHTTATTATLSSLNTSAAIGKVAYVTAESGIYVCTVSV